MYAAKENAKNATAPGSKKPGGLFFQPKLSVNQPGDAFEQEAGAMADKVMRMTDVAYQHDSFFKPASAKQVNHNVQRKCQACEEEEKHVHRKESSTAEVHGNNELDSYISSLGSIGDPMPENSRKFFEPRFGRDLSNVRVHNDGAAARSAQSINALAYTSGNHIVFNTGQYSPESDSGKRLLAHELTHTIQQTDSTNSVQRLCSSAAVCSAPSIPGSASGFDTSEEAREAAARNRRKGMSGARSLSTGHGGHARQLERFLEAQTPGRLSVIQGIFIDMDMSPGTGAMTQACGQWMADSLPPGVTPDGMAGATKHCVFVHPELNQQALAFNTTAAPTIGGMSREDWRVSTLQTLTHESQHGLFDTSPHGTPGGITTPSCTRATLANELTEISAEISEFPAAFRAIPVGAPAADPSRTRLSNWFNTAITDTSEGIRGNLLKMGCSCECTEVDAFVQDTFNFTTTSWTAAERSAFNTELRRPVWGIRWPITP